MIGLGVDLDHHRLAQILLLVFCGAQVIATPALDLNKTHATNPLWMGHARFHVVWQTASQCLAGLLAAWLAWGGRDVPFRFDLAEVVLGIPLCGFMAATVTRKAYGGALYDPNGIQPMRARAGGRKVEIDLNLVVVLTGFVVLGVIEWIYRH